MCGGLALLYAASRAIRSGRVRRVSSWNASAMKLRVSVGCSQPSTCAPARGAGGRAGARATPRLSRAAAPRVLDACGARGAEVRRGPGIVTVVARSQPHGSRGAIGAGRHGGQQLTISGRRNSRLPTVPPNAGWNAPTSTSPASAPPSRAASRTARHVPMLCATRNTARCRCARAGPPLSARRARRRQAERPRARAPARQRRRARSSEGWPGRHVQAARPALLARRRALP